MYIFRAVNASLCWFNNVVGVYLVQVCLHLIGQQGLVFLQYRIIGAPKKFKKWPRPLFGRRSYHTCHQKPNPSRETVLLGKWVSRWHRVDSALGFLSSRPKIGSPGPSPASECCSFPFGSGGGTHSLAGEGAGGPIRTKGQTLGYSRYSKIPLRKMIGNLVDING